MRISNTNTNIINIKPYNNLSSKFNNTNPIAIDNKNDYTKYTADNVKANFIPNFNGSRKIGYTFITDRDTLLPVYATIRKENVGNYSIISLVANRKESGYLVLQYDSVYPVAEHVMKLPTDNIPKITHFRTIEGNKYSGIGTALIKTAIQESYNNDSFGNLWLVSSKGYEKNASTYQSNTNPIPFYYKMGFQAPDKEENARIKEALNNKDYDKLPDVSVLLLTQNARKKWLKELAENPIIKFKKPFEV